MNKKTRFVVAGLLMATMALAPVAAIAQENQDKPKTPAAGSAPEKPSPAARAIPFRGAVSAVDKEAKTVTVGKMVFNVSADTKLIKGNQTITIADLTIGEVIAGNYTKGDDGKLTAKMIRVGPKVGVEEQPNKKAVEKKKSEPSPQ